MACWDPTKRRQKPWAPPTLRPPPSAEMALARARDNDGSASSDEEAAASSSGSGWRGRDAPRGSGGGVELIAAFVLALAARAAVGEDGSELDMA